MQCYFCRSEIDDGAHFHFHACAMTTYGITNPDQAVTIDYTNWRGERATRKIVPWELVRGSNEWHPQEQWLLRAYDVAKKETRTFAMSGIHAWMPPRKP